MGQPSIDSLLTQVYVNVKVRASPAPFPPDKNIKR